MVESHAVTDTEPGGLPPRSTATTLADYRGGLVGGSLVLRYALAYRNDEELLAERVSR
jgi:hypothetical protein